jgi:hypothetical protein
MLTEVTGYLDKRFVMTVFFPTLIFVMLGAGLVVLVQGRESTVEAWAGQSAETQFLLLGAALAGVVFVAYALDLFLMSLTRLFEGYWHWIGGGDALTETRVGYHRRRVVWLQERVDGARGRAEELRRDEATTKAAIASATDQARRVQLAGELAQIQAKVRSNRMEERRYQTELEETYPPPTRLDLVMPTRLGNILRAAEVYAYGRYGIDSVVVWPRLYVVLPEAVTGSLSNANSGMQLMILSATLGFAFAVLGAVYLVVMAANPLLYVAVMLGGLLLAAIAYRAAVVAALDYSLLIRAAFDTHRGALLKALGLKAPASLKEERALWRQVNLYLFRNYLSDYRAYTYAPSQPPGAGA